MRGGKSLSSSSASSSFCASRLGSWQSHHCFSVSASSYSGGPLAGASQPHLRKSLLRSRIAWPAPVDPTHAASRCSEQICSLLPSSNQLLQDPKLLLALFHLVRSLYPGALPSHLLTPTPPSGATTPSLLPLPYMHFYTPLPASPSSSTLHNIYHSLLSSSRAHLSSLAPSSLPPAGAKRSSYNLFLTAKHMHLIPRTERLVRIPRRASGEGEMRLSVNGLLFLGYWYVGSEEEAQDLMAYGVGKALRESGYTNEASWARKRRASWSWS
jgi:hypothetical protein